MDKSRFNLIKDAKKDKWDAIAQKYDDKLYTNEFYVINKNKVEYYYVKSNVSGKILDAGAGTGRFSIPLIEQGYRVFSCDLSYQMLSIAKSKNSEFIGILADLFNLPFRNNSFNSIFSITVLEHLPNYEKVIGEFKHVVKPNGVIIFEMRNKRNFKFRKSKDDKNLKHVHFSNFGDIHDIKNILRKHQLKLIHYYAYDFFTGNQIIRRLSFNSLYLYNLIFRLLNLIFKIPRLQELYYFIEIHLIKHLPDFLFPNSMIIIEKRS